MKTIPIERIDALWDEVEQMGEGPLRALAQRMQAEQPYILVYLLAGQELDEEQTGQTDSPLIELGSVVWHIMSRVQPRLRQVTDRDLEAAELANYRALEALDEGPEVRFEEAGSRLLDSYNQAPLLGAVTEALLGDDDDCADLAADTAGLDLLRLKTIIDCLDR